MTMTTAPAHPSFAELRELARTPVIRAWIELRKQEILCRDWDVIPSPEAAKSLHGDYRAMRAWAKAAEGAIGFFKRPDPDYWSFRSWLDPVVEDLLIADSAVVLLREMDVPGKARAVLLDAATVEPAVDQFGVLCGYVQYLEEVPRRDFADLASGPPPGHEVLHRFPADGCLYLRMNVRRQTPFGFSPLERAIRRRGDGSIDADATAAVFAEEALGGTAPVFDEPGRAALPRFLKDALFDVILGRLAGDGLQWEWGAEPSAALYLASRAC
jgi:hypothetical protein